MEDFRALDYLKPTTTGLDYVSWMVSKARGYAVCCPLAIQSVYQV